MPDAANDEAHAAERSLVSKPPKGGPGPMTQEDRDRIAAELKGLYEKREVLERELRDREERRMAEIKEARRSAAESRTQADNIKASMATKLAAQEQEHAALRKKDGEKIAAYVQRLKDDDDEIRALEREVAILKAAGIKPAATSYAAPAAAGNRASKSASGSETLAAFLERLQLSKYRALMVEEELDTPLLRTMGREVLIESMTELGLAAAEAQRMGDDLFPA